MPNFKTPRKNKDKKSLVSELQLIDATKRRRALIKDIVFPFMLEQNDTIGYNKVFLQAFSSLVNGVFDERRKTTTIVQITPRLTERLGEIFKVNDPEQKKEYDRYSKLIDSLKDISVEDLSYATEMPRYIDGFFAQKADKESISKVNIDDILGK